MFFGRYFDSHGPLRLLVAGTIVQVGAMIGIACEPFGMVNDVLSADWCGSQQELLAIILIAYRTWCRGNVIICAGYGYCGTMVPEKTKYSYWNGHLWKRDRRSDVPAHDQTAY